jgi:hypothetical protein
MKTGPERDPQQTAQCIYSIPCKCGRSYNELEFSQVILMPTFLVTGQHFRQSEVKGLLELFSSLNVFPL